MRRATSSPFFRRCRSRVVALNGCFELALYSLIRHHGAEVWTRRYSPIIATMEDAREALACVEEAFGG